LFSIAKSIYSIGPTQIGLVEQALWRKHPGDNPIAFKGEAGYQAELLMPACASSSVLIYAVASTPGCRVPRGKSAWSSRR